MNKIMFGALALLLSLNVGCGNTEVENVKKDINVDEEMMISIDERETVSGVFEGEFPKQIMSPLSRNIKMAEVGEFFVVAVTNDENATWKHELLTDDILEYVGEGDHGVSHYYGFRALKDGEAKINLSFRKEGMSEYDKDLSMKILVSKPKTDEEKVKAAFDVVPQAILTEENSGEWNLQNNRYLVIKVKGNATTGYNWIADTDNKNIVSIEKDEYLTEGTGMVGAGGEHYFLLKANSKGVATVNLEYKRPWEKDSEPMSTLSYKIYVDTLKDEVSYGASYDKEAKKLYVKMVSNIKDLEIEYTSSARFDVVIKKGDKEVYNYLSNNMFATVMGKETLNIGDVLSRTIDNIDLEAGEYVVEVKTTGNLKDAKPYSFNINVK